MDCKDANLWREISTKRRRGYCAVLPKILYAKQNRSTTNGRAVLKSALTNQVLFEAQQSFHHNQPVRDALALDW